MTFDLRIEQVCTHLVVDEVLTLESDLRTIRTLRPIANAQVEVKINGFLVEDPSDATNGYVLVRDPRAIDPTARLLKFRSLRKATDEYYEVTYYTRASECRRCMGLRIENDYRYTLDGQLETVVEEEKLIQEVKKIVTTLVTSNPFHTWYGTSIPALIGGKISNAGFIRTKLMNEITVALTQYASLQRQQARLQEGKVTPGERFSKLLQVQVDQDVTEPTAFNITIAFTNQKRETLVNQMTIRLPDPQSLVYNTPQSSVSN
jgi:phage baseplate assembly protein W